MKKLLTLLFLLCSISVFANANNKEAVTMENFEQRWLDHESTIALKNNTNETIHNISYRITYLDMNGKALDYADYTSTIDIEPGMVKKTDIPSRTASPSACKTRTCRSSTTCSAGWATPT